MHIEHAVARKVEHLLGQQLPVRRHNADIGRESRQCRDSFGRGNLYWLEDRKPAFLGKHLERVHMPMMARTRFVGLRDKPHDLMGRFE
jgi:hypothetical protein